ncbi:MAG: hypothetical protein SFV23_17130 [Planctomycetaceae bacterium]|nr:hypothetical protein [Planctomycetaceae bacterium]
MSCYAVPMNPKISVPAQRFWWAVAAYLFPTFPLGYVWHLVLFRRQYHELQLYRDEVLIPLGLASMAIQSLAFAWIYPRVFSTRRECWSSSAAQFFALFAVLSWSFTTLPVAAKYRMDSIPMFLSLETAFTLVQFLAVSPLIAFAYREKN